MSDPFSAAASAVGCISLGLQVCQYLVTYCQAYKNYDEDVERIGITAQGLRKPLKVLRDLIEETQATNPEMAADLGEKALGLQSRVDNLKTMLDQFKAAVPGDFAGQLKGHLTKVVYPFHKGALRDILMDLNGMQAVLQTTLSIYSAQRLSRIELIQENILQEVRQIHIGVQSIPKNTMPPPAMLASWCNCYSNFQRSTDRCLTSNVDTLVPESSTSESSHSKTPPTSCQRLRIKQRKELFRKTYRYLSSLFRVVVTVSFSMSTGAGGFSIAPSLTFQAVVKFEGSFASMLYQKLDLPIKAPAFDSENVAHGLRQIMQQGFGEGKVAPSDIFYTFEGSYLSLLDILVQWIGGHRLPSLYPIMRILMEHGTIANDDTRNELMDHLLRRSPFGEQECSIFDYLIDYQNPWTLGQDHIWPEKRSNIKYILFRDRDFVALPDTARIILQDSEEELERALRLGRVSPNEKSLGCSLLELAFGWPKGLQMLIDAGADIRKGTSRIFNRLLPYHEESHYFDSCYQCFEILIGAGYEVKVDDLLYLCDCSQRLAKLFVDVSAVQRQRLCNLDESYWSQDRLGALRGYEDAYVPTTDEYISITWQATFGSALLNRMCTSAVYNPPYSFMVMDTLQNAGFSDFDTPDHNGITPLMHTCECLIGEKEIRKILWFLLKGADVQRSLPSSKSRLAHLLSARVTMYVLIGYHWSVFEIMNYMFQCSDDRTPQRKRLFFPAPNIKDSCVCACCLDGCTIFSVALRQAIHHNLRGHLSDKLFRFRELLDSIAEWTQVGPRMHQELIRLLTFDALDLKHTCCIEIDCSPEGVLLSLHGIKGRDEEELVAIREENQQGIEMLEELVPMFEAKLNELGIAIWDFLGGYWHAYMTEYISELNSYDNGHDSASRDLGESLQDEDN